MLDADAELHGKQIFLRIFEEAPPIKDLFPFRCAWGDKLLQVRRTLPVDPGSR